MRPREWIEETLRIAQTGEYEVNGEKIIIPELDEVADVHVYDTVTVKKCVACAQEKILATPSALSEFIIDASDSFVAAQKYGTGKTLVLNFANAYHPGGGFLYGSIAQEETLCLCSTLYRSLTSEKAAELYEYNRTQRSPSDYLLISPRVVVFRNIDDYSLRRPFETSVISSAAPNLAGGEADLSADEVEEMFERKIGNVLAAAASEGYETLILGAWGCGAFANDAKDVARYFYHKLIDEQFATLFKRIVFAIYVPPAPRLGSVYNLNQFEQRFATLLK